MERKVSGLKIILRNTKKKNYQSRVLFEAAVLYCYIKNKNYFNGGTTSNTTPNTKPNITEKEKLIIKLIKDNPHVTVKDIVEIAGNIIIDGVKYNLKRLKEKGIIKRIDSNRR